MNPDLDRLDRLYVKEGAHATGSAYPALSAELRSSRARIENLRAAIASVLYRLETQEPRDRVSLPDALRGALEFDDVEANR